jgi:hypothetical protein
MHFVIEVTGFFPDTLDQISQTGGSILIGLYEKGSCGAKL